MEFVLGQAVDFEESLTCEFKEVKSQPITAVTKIVDEYIVAFLNESGGSIFWGIRDGDRVVTALPVTDKLRDELMQVIGQKIAAIAPPVPGSMVEPIFHLVRDSAGLAVPDKCVLEVRVAKPALAGLFLTGSGEAYRRALGGNKKLSGAELFVALATALGRVRAAVTPASQLARLPTVHRRATLVESLIRNRRVLWVDDDPSSVFLERLALGELGIHVDVAVSTAEGLRAAKQLRPDAIVSDIDRGGDERAGLHFLSAARAAGIKTPFIFYVGAVIKSLGVPPGAFAITDQPDEVLHYVLDVLERDWGREPR